MQSIGGSRFGHPRSQPTANDPAQLCGGGRGDSIGQPISQIGRQWDACLFVLEYFDRIREKLPHSMNVCRCRLADPLICLCADAREPMMMRVNVFALVKYGYKYRMVLGGASGRTRYGLQANGRGQGRDAVLSICCDGCTNNLFIRRFSSGLRTGA